MSPFFRQSVAATLVIVAMIAVLGASQGEGSVDVPSKGIPVNSVCVFSESSVRTNPPAATYNGYTVGFCCRGCEKLWESLPEEEKDAALGKFFPGRTPRSPLTAEALGIARAYLSGLNTGQLASLDRLFLPEARSSILENASDEGSWKHYRDHHLKPEIESASNFKFNVIDEKSERFGSTVLVRQVGTFTVQIGEEVHAYRAAVSYFIVEDAGELRIAHLHWSSRPDQRTATRP